MSTQKEAGTVDLREKIRDRAERRRTILPGEVGGSGSAHEAVPSTDLI